MKMSKWFGGRRCDKIKKVFSPGRLIIQNMLSIKDIAILREMFREHGSRFDQKLDDLKIDLRDEFYSVIKAEVTGSERRMIARMDEGFQAITELIDEGVLSQINDLDRRVTRLESVNMLA